MSYFNLCFWCHNPHRLIQIPQNKLSAADVLDIHVFSHKKWQLHCNWCLYQSTEECVCEHKLKRNTLTIRTFLFFNCSHSAYKTCLFEHWMFFLILMIIEAQSTKLNIELKGKLGFILAQGCVRESWIVGLLPVCVALHQEKKNSFRHY